RRAPGSTDAGQWGWGSFGSLARQLTPSASERGGRGERLMRFPMYRARRLRESTALRRLVQETRLAPSGFILPLFAVRRQAIRQEISSMPGQYHLSVDQTVEEARSVVDHGIPAVLLFGLPEAKDP